MLCTHIQWCPVALRNPLGVSMMPRCDLQDIADNRPSPGDRGFQLLCTASFYIKGFVVCPGKGNDFSKK